MKKSLIEAHAEAKRMSEKFPDVIYYVMDKPRKRAGVYSSEWSRRELILEGWHTVAKYLNGKEI